MDAVILAAGNSKRFGANKLLHEINGKLMYEYILERMDELQQQGLCARVLVVTQYHEIAEKVLRTYPFMEVVHNGNPEWGIAHSISLGIQKLENEEEGACLFTVSDQPHLHEKSLRGFLEAYEQSEQKIGICGHGTRMGNPVIFDRKYYPELAHLRGDKGGKQVVLKHLDETFLYQIPQMELEDIDVRSIDE